MYNCQIYCRANCININNTRTVKEGAKFTYVYALYLIKHPLTPPFPVLYLYFINLKIIIKLSLDRILKHW